LKGADARVVAADSPVQAQVLLAHHLLLAAQMKSNAALTLAVRYSLNNIVSAGEALSPFADVPLALHRIV
jgi:hypothetical protein